MRPNNCDTLMQCRCIYLCLVYVCVCVCVCDVGVWDWGGCVSGGIAFFTKPIILNYMIYKKSSIDY